MPKPPNPILDPQQNDDIDEDGDLDVEWYPLPDYLADADEEADEVTAPAKTAETTKRGAQHSRPGRFRWAGRRRG